MNKVSSKQVIFLLIIFTFSLATALTIMMDSSRPDYYSLLPLLPLSFLGVNILCVGILKGIPSNIGLTLIIFLYFFRLVFIPFFMVLGDYQSLIKFNIEVNMDKAIYLLIYELIVVYLVLYFAYASNKNIGDKERIFSKRAINFRLFGFVLSGLIMFVLFVWIVIPESQQIYKTIFDMGDPNFSSGFYNYRTEFTGGLERVLLTLFVLIMDFVIIFVPAYFMVQIKKKLKSKKRIIISVPFIFIPFLFVSATIAQSVITAFLLLLFLGKLYTDKRNKIYFLSIILATFFVVLYFIVRFNTGMSRYGNENLLHYLSSVLISYFSGVDSIAAIFNLPQTTLKWESLFFNIYGAIPFNNTLFGMKGINLQNLFNLANDSHGQIPPTIAAGKYYFGFIFAPVFSAIIAFISIKYGFKAQNQQNLWKYISYTFLSLVMAMGLVVYNETIILRWFTNLILPMLFLSYLSDDDEFDFIKNDDELNYPGKVGNNEIKKGC